jgi:hypothetical protein
VDAAGLAGRDPGLIGARLAEPPTRVVALGASNLTRGFPTLVSTAREKWGPEAEVLVALGLGRSYGAPSRVLFRTLPGILQSGLWQQLERSPEPATRGLITDVGNDILYGFGAEQILAWVEECLVRLRRITPDLVLTDLPLVSIRRLSRARFLFFRSILVPRCRLSFEQVLETAEQVTEGLARLAASRGARFFRLRPEWYGLDPVHIRPRMWRRAWREILSGEAAAEAPPGCSRLEALRLFSLSPERQWLLGVEQVTPQAGLRLPSGGRVWLY